MKEGLQARSASSYYGLLQRRIVHTWNNNNKNNTRKILAHGWSILLSNDCRLANFITKILTDKELSNFGDLILNEV